MSAGPYLNEVGDWWVPVDAGSFRQARASVVGCLSYDIPEDGSLLYRGKEVAQLDDEHEFGCNESDCPTTRHVIAYHFQENRRW